MVRAWEVWPSNNKIYCNGRFITGPDNGAFWAAEIMTIVPTICFWVFVCVPLWTDVAYGPLFIFPSIFLSVLLIGCHFASSFVEPGIIPRGELPIPDALSREEVHDGKHVTITFCRTCRIWRPPRAHHCKDCDNCIQEFDHHCPWVGNCVGKRNYRWFNLFLWFIIIDALYIAAVSIFHFIIRVQITGKPWPEVIPLCPANIVLCIYAVVILLTVAGLCGYHCSLICVGKTTYESIKRIEGDALQESCCFRFYSVLCGPAFPSEIDLQKHVEEFEPTTHTDPFGLPTLTHSDSDDESSLLRN